MKRYYYCDTVVGNGDVNGPAFINEIDSKIYDGAITDQCLVALEREAADDNDQVWIPYLDLNVERAECLSCEVVLLGGPKGNTWKCNECDTSIPLSFLLRGAEGYSEVIQRLKSDSENGVSFLQMSAELRFECEERFKILIKKSIEKWSSFDVQLYDLWSDYPGKEKFYALKRQLVEESGELREIRNQLEKVNYKMDCLVNASLDHESLLKGILSSLGNVGKGTNASGLRAFKEMLDDM